MRNRISPDTKIYDAKRKQFFYCTKMKPNPKQKMSISNSMAVKAFHHKNIEMCFQKKMSPPINSHLTHTRTVSFANQSYNKQRGIGTPYRSVKNLLFNKIELINFTR